MMTHNTAIDQYRTSQLFERAYRSGWWARVWSWLGKQAPQLLDLNAFVGDRTRHSTHSEGLHTIPLTKIVGSEGRTKDFDRAFRPLTRHSAERWRGIVGAWLAGKEMPPVELIRVGDQYFVRDGHHRISVAAQMGQQEIEAVVTVWELSPGPTQTAAPRTKTGRTLSRRATSAAFAN